MDNINYTVNDNTLYLLLSGKIDSNNAREAEDAINDVLSANPLPDVIIDADQLEYISSAGLRIILRLRKKFPELSIIDAAPEVYEIFDMTGFTEMMKVEKAYRKLSVDGCEIIGKGANGIVYRIDPETIIKVYKHADSLPDIHKERELARKAFVMGIPTAIPYDVVKVGDSYGSVFELLSATSFSKLLAAHPENMDQYVDLYVDLLKKIHSAELREGELPDQRLTGIEWIKDIKGQLPDETYKKILSMVEAIPEDHHMIHGDYHTKNVMFQNGETLLIDMDTICEGHPIYEFAAMYMAYKGFDEGTPENTLKFLGYPHETGMEFWRKTVAKYFGNDSEEFLRSIEAKAGIIGYSRLLRRTLKRNTEDPESWDDRIERCKKHLLEFTAQVDSLVF